MEFDNHPGLPSWTFGALGQSWSRSPLFRGPLDLSWGWGGFKGDGRCWQVFLGGSSWQAPTKGGWGLGVGGQSTYILKKIVLCNQCKLYDPPFRRGNLSKMMEKRTYKINCLKVLTCKNQTLLLVNNANCVVPVFQGADLLWNIGIGMSYFPLTQWFCAIFEIRNFW